MRAALLAALAIGASVASPPSLAGEGNGPPAPDALRKRIAALEQTVRKLEGIVEGTAHPVNLGRTSLATVDASSVNGGRALDNKFYGVVNAFDGGENWHNKINYTYWLSGGGAAQWIEVRFDRPVTVTSVAVDSAPGFTAQFAFAKGGEEIRTMRPSAAELAPPRRPNPLVDASPMVGGQPVQGSPVLKLREPLHGVARVRLLFRHDQGNTRVNEVFVMGHIPPGVDYKVGRPRVLLTVRNAEAIARQAFEEWQAALKQGATSRRQEDEQAIVITYSKGGLDLFRVTIRKKDGTTTTEALAGLSPARTQPK